MSSFAPGTPESVINAANQRFYGIQTPQPMGGKGGGMQQSAAPQPMGGKGGGMQQFVAPQPMGGKGGFNPMQQIKGSISNMVGLTPQPTTMGQMGGQQSGAGVNPDFSQFDANTTQAEFDRARGITPAEARPQVQPRMNRYVSMDRFGGGFNPYAGGFGGGFRPMGGKGGYGGGFYNPYAMGFFKDGGEVK